jgi:putative membrane protein
MHRGVLNRMPNDIGGRGRATLPARAAAGNIPAGTSPEPDRVGLRWMFATFHLLALGIGLGAIWARSRALRPPLDAAALDRVFEADTWWGISALLWISTGLVRVFSGLEKGVEYYLRNDFFLAKMLLLVAILVLEAGVMRGLLRWRFAIRRGETPDTSAAASFATRSYVQAMLVVLMVLAAAAMARGFGMR